MAVDWVEQLRAQVAEPGGWSLMPIVSPDGSVACRRFKVCRVAVGPPGLPPGAIPPLLGRVNDRPFAGAARGTLAFEGCVTRIWGPEMLRFVVADRPWNESPTPNGWAVLRDEAGETAFPEADFEAALVGPLTPSWRDRPPLL